ncbi:hypothetical protein MLD38_016122 [Melastoma candidum]|uniref:Uncharacterized protein n=1 Tax=Melastoma candidum TaxID=119954 RepID=A0ACB9RHQ2_9MYRT|nr:hypothetical protein MLD38_016122 [Melastoma candidum]
MGSHFGTCEISEVAEEPAVIRYSKESSSMRTDEKEGKQTVIRLALRDSLEDDINQLFESFRIKSSSRVSSPSHPEGTSPMRRNTLKKPITVGVHRPTGFGTSEAASLKHALRDLCLSKALETAAVKRSSIPVDPSRVSEAGRIKHLYNSKIVEVGPPGSSSSKDKETVVEITLVPEECLKYPKKAQEGHPPNLGSRKNDESHTQKNKGTIFPASKDTGWAQNDLKQSAFSTNSMSSDHSTTNSHRAHSPASAIVAVASAVASSAKSNAPTGKVHNVGTDVQKVELSSGDGSLPSISDVGCATKTGYCDNTLTVDPGEVGDKPIKQGHKGRKVQGRSLSSGFVHSKRVGRVVKNSPRVVKPVIRMKSINKKKEKHILPPTSSIPEKEMDNNCESGLGPSQLICQRCQCSFQTPNKETKKPSEILSCEDRVNSIKSNARIPPNNCKDIKSAADCVTSTAKLRDKGEFSQSSKSSLGDFSSSTTSLSGESNPSRSSCSNRPHTSEDAGWVAIRQIRMQEGNLGLRHFNLLKKLGCGDIGTVYLAELISTSCLFAIKVMDNDFLARRKKMLRAQTEREILRILDHPFLPTLYTQFTLDNLSCLVMEYCPGGDLHVLRQKQPGRYFQEPAARFYVAEVLLALEYLHMLGIIYRDLKPENILVKDDGHIMLTDFDLSLRCLVHPTLLHSSTLAYEPAKISGPCTESSCIQPFCSGPSCRVSCFSPKPLPWTGKKGKSKLDPAISAKSLLQLVAEPTDARSNSFVGTHEYLAPEIIKGEGHGAAVDWWMFGIFLYELLYGRTPFKGAGNEETLANVVLQSLRFPESPAISSHAQDLISRVLTKDPERRLGSEKGAAEIKQHPFFEGLNWALIRSVVPPELPESYDFAGVRRGKLIECNAAGEHLEFELF